MTPRGRRHRAKATTIVAACAGMLAAGPLSEGIGPSTSRAQTPDAPMAQPKTEPTADATRYVLQVVGIYRPLELEGRFVEIPREVYLQAIATPSGPLEALIGQTLDVTRRMPVPAMMPMAPAPDPVLEPMAAPPAEEIAEGDGDTRAEAPRRRRRRRRRQQIVRPTAAPAAEASPTADGSATPPAASDAAEAAPGSNAATGPSELTPGMAPAAERVEPEAVSIVRPEQPAMPTRFIEAPVGRLEVIAIRGEVAVARVVDDGVDPPPMSPLLTPPTGPSLAPPPNGGVDVPAIMSGDIARLVIEPPPPEPPPPLSDDENARLQAERDALERDDRRRRVRPKKYERPVMRWEL